MTQETRIKLTEDLNQAEKQLSKVSSSAGEAAGDNCDWHDNGAYDTALMEITRLNSYISSIKKQLDKKDITLPREEIDDVGIGNTVTIYFDEIGEKKITLLTPEDAGVKPDWISNESPIGKKILGKKVGKVDDKLTIIKIEKGFFDLAIKNTK